MVTSRKRTRKSASERQLDDSLSQVRHMEDLQSKTQREYTALEMRFKSLDIAIGKETTAKESAIKEAQTKTDYTEALLDQILVLQSDRDRLTTVVEVLARRLMSPVAERDATRAGWRAFARKASDFGTDAGFRAGHQQGGEKVNKP